MDYSKLLKAGKDYAKSQMTPENLLKASTKFQGKQINPNKAAPIGQTEAAPTATSSTMSKYLPYIVAAIAIVIVIFVMKKK